MTHDELDIFVQAQARGRGLLPFHFTHAQRSVTEKGWPDWTILGPRGVLFRENKVPPDHCTGEQRRVGYLLQADGLNWAVWTPADVESGLIEHELESIR